MWLGDTYYPVNEKRLICFPPTALDWLKARAEELEVSVSEVVRQLVVKERERLRRREAGR